MLFISPNWGLVKVCEKWDMTWPLLSPGGWELVTGKKVPADLTVLLLGLVMEVLDDDITNGDDGVVWDTVALTAGAMGMY